MNIAAELSGIAQQDTILIVDDNSTNLAVIMNFLHEHEFKTLVATDGELALQSAKYAHPDLILLDIVMPGMDGFEICRHLKAREATKEIPVIFMTSLTSIEDKVKGFEAGGVDYITKPIQPEEVLARIRMHLELQAMRAQLREQNLQLQQEIAERLCAEEQLMQHQKHLDELIKDRTAALVRERNLLRTLIDHIPDYVYVKDTNGRWLLVNQAVAHTINQQTRDAILDKTDLNFFPPDLAEQSAAEDREVLTSGIPLINSEALARDRETGAERWLLTTKVPFRDSQGNIVGLVGITRDITDQKHIEALMVQSEKMISVGGLAAGMAHEINNPLSGMLQSAQNIVRRTSPDLKQNYQVARECGTELEKIRAYLERRGIFHFVEDIRESGRRASTIVADMLHFSRRSEAHKTPVNLAALLEKTVHLAGTDYDLKKHYDFRHIRIEREYDPDLPQVLCVTTEIEQVLLNLLRNAAQAMVERGERSEPPAILLRTCREGRMARIEVEDNGPGMNATVRKRLFEPFFTTKRIGEGTGLGLSVSYFIITENHQGTIEVESTEGKGTKFIIRLPLEA